MIADSNLAIYAIGAKNSNLEAWFSSTLPAMSGISRVECLGYRKITADEILRYRILFGMLTIHPVDDRVIEKAITLRQSKRMSLPDSIIAATALVQGVPLATANETDFTNLPGLHVVNPMRP